MKTKSGIILFATVFLLPTHIDASLSTSNVTNQSCPIWTTPQEINQCKCGISNDHTVICDNNTLDVYVLLFHCMSYSKVLNTTVVGHCLYNLHGDTYNLVQRFYWKLPKLYQKNNNTALCMFKNCFSYHLSSCTRYQYQTGLMCTSCVDGYAYPVYSYSLECVKCKDYKYNWMKYIAVAFLPLTMFYIIIILFRKSVNSGAVSGYVLVCQLVATPMTTRIINNTSFKNVKGMYISLLAIWNLDFFRGPGIYSPFCLYPKLNTLQTLMLDYVIAVYPLFLVTLTYICVKLHNRYIIVVKLWSPFYKCFALIRKNWDINDSLVSAFATFLLLSYVKILNVSFYALTPNTLYDQNGNATAKRFLYYDGTYEYFGAAHIPYALLALFMVLVFNIFPLLLLCLHPCRCYHKCLNYCRLQSLTLHIFMDTFNGCYKIQPIDCRYFAAVYLLIRLLAHVFLSVSIGLYFFWMGFVFVTLSVSVAVFKPHKRLKHTVLDVVLFATTGMIFFGVSAYRSSQILESSDVKHFHNLTLVAGLFPLFFSIFLVISTVVPKKFQLKLKTIFLYFITKHRNTTQSNDPVPYRLEHSDEYPPLLPLPPEV